MVGTFREPSCGRSRQPIHSIPYSVAQPLERGSNNYYSIIQGAATEDRQEQKTAQAAASAKYREGGVPQQELERFARFLLPKIQAFYQSEEGKRLFEEWKKKRR